MARTPLPILLLTLALLGACGDGSDEIETGPPGQPSASGGPDLSSPMTAAKAFWAAYLRKDVRTATACIAETTRSEQLRQVLAGDANALAYETNDGTDWSIERTRNVDMFDGDTKAEVKTVTRNRHNVDFLVVQTSSGWKIESFDI